MSLGYPQRRQNLVYGGKSGFIGYLMIRPPGSWRMYWKTLEGLVLWMDFNQCQTIDLSGHGNNGTIYGAQCVQGRSGKALSFDGSDDYVEVPHSESLGAKTFVAWFKSNKWAESGGWSPTIVNKYTDDYNMFRIAFDESAGGRVAASVKVGGTEVGRFGTGGVSLNEWHHLVVVFTNSVKIYLDGINITSTNSCSWSRYTIDNKLYIGRRGNGGYFNGIIDEARIYNRALSEEEIKWLYKHT